MASYNKNEIRDIIIAVATLTVIFAFPSFSFIPIAFLAVVIAFLFHELAHRYIAKKFDAVAYFKLFPQGLLFGLLLLIFGFKAAAPGAVVVQPYRYSRWKYRITHLSVNEWGWIAAGGPITNILFAILFAGIAFAFPVVSFAAKFIFLVNAILAAFNLIPFGPLDGAKIVRWKPWFWTFLFIISAVLVWFAYS
jgi:Zn-dependent protease